MHRFGVWRDLSLRMRIEQVPVLIHSIHQENSMALMFPRLARNFVKNGYFPTDEATLVRTLSALAPSPGSISILDPCAGEGVAIAEVAHALGRDQVQAFAVEYNSERARHARQLVDRCIQGDLMDTLISRQSFGLLWLNPPYGDLSKDANGNVGYQGQGRARLEKQFYQRSLPLLQYGGVLVFIVPAYVLDAELVGWLTRHFAELRIYRAVETQFKQVVIFGRRIRQRDQASDSLKATRALLQIGCGDVQAEELPPQWPFAPYIVPTSAGEPEHFYRITMEPEQFADEVDRLQGLWPMVDAHLGAVQQSLRPPARALSHWHLALALAAGAISGVLTSKSGRVLAVKGDTHKDKTLHTEYTERDDGSMAETRILTDKFVPVIRAWDLTPGSTTRGEVLTIR
jgi:tRNA1(Val) A37 N6-methylase TrmN6